MVKPACAEPTTKQPSPQDCRQPQTRGDVPQVLLTHSAKVPTPLVRTRQTWPAGHVMPGAFMQETVMHAPVVIDQRGMALLPETQDAIVRPAPGQSS